MKCWKKVTKDPTFNQFVKFNKNIGGSSSLFVFKQDYIKELKKKSHWTVEFVPSRYARQSEQNALKNQKDFNSRKEALDFANKFMKKNSENC